MAAAPIVFGTACPVFTAATGALQAGQCMPPFAFTATSVYPPLIDHMPAYRTNACARVYAKPARSARDAVETADLLADDQRPGATAETQLFAPEAAESSEQQLAQSRRNNKDFSRSPPGGELAECSARRLRFETAASGSRRWLDAQDGAKRSSARISARWARTP